MSSFFKKFFTPEKKEDLDKGMEKTKQGFFNKLGRAVAGKDRVDEEVLDELESVLISSARPKPADNVMASGCPILATELSS